MADREVEETLREIRERVRAATVQPTPPAASAAGVAASPSATAGPSAVEANGRGAAPDALSRLEAHLSTTERAWNRLPPVLSNRGGWVARLELWVKRKIKRALHWVTWEQVNFNSSVHQALREARAALAAHEQLISGMRSEMQSESASQGASLRQLKAEAEAERTRVDARMLELGSRLAASEAKLGDALSQTQKQLSSDIVRLRDEMRAHVEGLGGARDALVEAWRGEQAALAEGLRGEQGARLAEFEREVRERTDALLEEQRVCFRQLSLEAGEAAVMHDRARRQLEARLEEIEKAVNRDR